jgi:hypothetical protein
MILRDVPTEQLEQTYERVRYGHMGHTVQFFRYGDLSTDADAAASGILQVSLSEIECELQRRKLIDLERRVKFLENYRDGNY